MGFVGQGGTQEVVSLEGSPGGVESRSEATFEKPWLGSSVSMQSLLFPRKTFSWLSSAGMAELTSVFLSAACRWQLLCEAVKAEADRKSIRGNVVNPLGLKDTHIHTIPLSLWISLPAHHSCY